MSKLPRSLPAKKVIRALKKSGFYIRRQRGSHVIMRRDMPFAQVVVPMHSSLARISHQFPLRGGGEGHEYKEREKKSAEAY